LHTFKVEAMEKAAKPTFTVVAMPRLPPDTQGDAFSIELAQKSRAFRLHALKTAPEAFAASYEVESQRGLDQTIERLSKPKAINIAALAIEEDNKMFEQGKHADLLLTQNWIGITALVGPQESSLAAISAKSDPFSQVTASRNPAAPKIGVQTSEEAGAERERLRFHIAAVFVDPSARGQGVGSTLLKFVLKKAEEFTRGVQSGFACTILVDSNNMAARRLYEKVGFRAVGDERYVQQPRALAGESHVHERTALRMEVMGDVTGS
jgi:ribosomal protein S18 acetylase RimI-like enzyme